MFTLNSIPLDNLMISGNTISSEDTNGDIILNPNGTGSVTISSGSSLVLGSGNINVTGNITVSGTVDGVDISAHVGGNSHIDWTSASDNLSTSGTIAASNFSGSSSNTNTGDQTSIVGITGTKSQFNTAVTDGNFMYVGDAPTSHTHTFADLPDLSGYHLLGRVISGTGDMAEFQIGDLATTSVTGGKLLYETSGGVLEYKPHSDFVSVTGGSPAEGEIPVYRTSPSSRWVYESPTGVSWSVKTANYTASAGDGILANISSGTITLPSTLTVGDEIIISNINSSTLTVADNGNTIRYAGTSYTNNVTMEQGETIHLVAASTSIWEIV